MWNHWSTAPPWPLPLSSSHPPIQYLGGLGYCWPCNAFAILTRHLELLISLPISGLIFSDKWSFLGPLKAAIYCALSDANLAKTSSHLLSSFDKSDRLIWNCSLHCCPNWSTLISVDQTYLGTFPSVLSKRVPKEKPQILWGFDWKSREIHCGGCPRLCHKFTPFCSPGKREKEGKEREKVFKIKDTFWAPGTT